MPTPRKVFLHEQSKSISGIREPNARLTVNCPAGSTVTTVSGDIRYEKSVDSYGKAVFPGLHHGVWDVTIDNGVQTASQSVDVVTDYEVTIDFFAATISITYPVGATCTVSNGGTTLTAPDTTGTWACIVPNAGTWTVTVTSADGSETKSKQAYVASDGQKVDVSIVFFMATINVTYPPGAICSCYMGSIIYSASDTSGSWSFTILKAGRWTVKVSDGIQTQMKSVDITDDLQVESVSFKFFAATINITYPVGATCTVTDETTTFNAPDTSGSWTVTVPRVGFWTVKAVSSNRSVVETVEITEDGENKSVVCKFFTSYINVEYPSGTFKVVLWYIGNLGEKSEIAVDTSGNGKCRFIVAQIGSYEIGAYRVPPYVGIETKPGDYNSDKTYISVDEQIVTIRLNYNSVPEFSYTGTYKITDDEGNSITESYGDWNIQLLTSGVLNFTKLRGAATGIDLFLVGGGGNGGNFKAGRGQSSGYSYGSGGGGGGGGYCETVRAIVVNEETSYDVTVGGGGGNTTAFGITANAGNAGGDATDWNDFGDEGAGGTGGSDGGKGGMCSAAAEDGIDGKYAFSMTRGVRYGAGGGGGSGYNGSMEAEYPDSSQSYAGLGGKDGGGDHASNAKVNSGGGGGGGDARKFGATAPPGKGGSGIVIIRNKR